MAQRRTTYRIRGSHAAARVRPQCANRAPETVCCEPTRAIAGGAGRPSLPIAAHRGNAVRRLRPVESRRGAPGLGVGATARIVAPPLPARSTSPRQPRGPTGAGGAGRVGRLRGGAVRVASAQLLIGSTVHRQFVSLRLPLANAQVNGA